jgi:hypothetical protein
MNSGKEDSIMEKIYSSYPQRKESEFKKNEKIENKGKDGNEENKYEEKNNNVITPNRYEKPAPQTKFLEFDEARQKYLEFLNS